MIRYEARDQHRKWPEVVYKIGRTGEPARRIPELLRWSVRGSRGGELEALGKFDDMVLAERAVHHVLKDEGKWYRGELFVLDREEARLYKRLITEGL